MTHAIELRSATGADVNAVAALWESGWRETHLGRVPSTLTAHRDARSLSHHAQERITTTTLAVIAGEVAGFVMTHRDEIDQLYVDSRFRRQGIAATLLRAGENRIAADYPRGWLAVIEVNRRARRFYERNGWCDAGSFTHRAWVTTGNPIEVPVRRYEKELRQ